MANPSDIPVRDARDRLIDLITGIGHPYPLRDLAVHDSEFTVAFGERAAIIIEFSQKDVRYELHDRDGKPVGDDASATIQASGNGGRLELKTPALRKDQIYRIHAIKPLSGNATYLHARVTVRVGPNAHLNAWIRKASLLDAGLMARTAPRIIDYAGSVEVEIQNSQEGVDYKLVESKDGKEQVISTASVRGDGHHIVLQSQALHEDVDIRVRATITYDHMPNKPTRTCLLDTTLPLKVRANPAVDVSVESAIIDYQQQATLSIANSQKSVTYRARSQKSVTYRARSQKSVTYRAHWRPIADLDYLPPSIPDADVLTVSVPGEADVRVRKPPVADPWQAPAGYTASHIAERGNGGCLRLAVPALSDDSVVIVEAYKTYQMANGEVRASVQVTQAAMILVRPNPAPDIRVQARQVTPIRYRIEVVGGQSGVLYTPRLPRYLQEHNVNPGLGHLRVEVDFVIAPDPEPADTSRPNMAPEVLKWALERLPANPTLDVDAKKVKTGVEIRLDAKVRLELPSEMLGQAPG